LYMAYYAHRGPAISDDVTTPPSFEKQVELIPEIEYYHESIQKHFVNLKNDSIQLFREKPAELALWMSTEGQEWRGRYVRNQHYELMFNMCLIHEFAYVAKYRKLPEAREGGGKLWCEQINPNLGKVIATERIL